MTRWLVLLLLPLTAQAAELLPAWQNWQYVRPVHSNTPQASAWARIPLPPEIYGPAQDNLADLRLIDDTAREIPYLLHARHEQCQHIWRDAPISDSGFVPGQYSQIVIDTSTQGEPHNALEVHVAQQDFFAWTEIAASEDRSNWRIVREKAPLYRFAAENHKGSGERLDYPLTHSRWLRLRLLQGEAQLAVTSARVTREIRTEAEHVALPSVFVANMHNPEKESWLQADLGMIRPPISALRFASAQTEFHRQVSISTSADGKNWRHLASGQIYRHGTDKKETRSGLTITFPESQARHWRVTVFNRDDPALPGMQVEALSTPRHLIFRPETGKAYRLLYGNQSALAPQYELARITSDSAWQSAQPATLGEQATNEGYVSAAPWSERNPWLLWATLLVAVSGLGWIAIRTLRHGGAEMEK